jgi:hypothetical protein
MTALADVYSPHARGAQQYAACTARKRRIARLLAHDALQLGHFLL